MFSSAATTATAAAATATSQLQRRPQTQRAVEPSSSMELEVERSTATRSAEEMTTEMPQPIAKRKVEPKDKKRELEEYVGKDMASSSSQHTFALEVLQIVDKAT